MKTVIIKPVKIEIDPKLKIEIKCLCEEECQVVVHCSILIPYPMRLRIWKNTHLISHSSNKQSVLVHAENISFHPQWTICYEGIHEFTLFFKGLPKDCLYFDLFEVIPESGGFMKINIKRNKSDVYHIKF